MLKCVSALERRGHLGRQADQHHVGQQHSDEAEQEPHARQVAPDQPRHAQKPLGQQDDRGQDHGQKAQRDAHQLPRPMTVVLQLRGDHRQVADGQRPFAEQAAERVGDSQGDGQSIHHPAGHAQQIGRDHVADHAQHAARQDPQARDARSHDQGMSAAVFHGPNRKGPSRLAEGGFGAKAGSSVDSSRCLARRACDRRETALLPFPTGLGYDRAYSQGGRGSSWCYPRGRSSPGAALPNG